MLESKPEVCAAPRGGDTCIDPFSACGTLPDLCSSMQLAAMEVNRIYAARWCKWGTSVLVTLAVAMLAARTRGTHPTLGPYVPTAATNASNFGCSTNGLCSTNCRVDAPRLSQLLGGIALQCQSIYGTNCQYIREIAGSGATAGINTLLGYVGTSFWPITMYPFTQGSFYRGVARIQHYHGYWRCVQALTELNRLASVCSGNGLVTRYTRRDTGRTWAAQGDVTLAQPNGTCLCPGPPRASTGAACQFTDILTCSGNGVAQHDGSCVCSDPAIVGSGCQYSNNVTCSGYGIAQFDGSCVCSDPTVVGSGCQFSNSRTCSGSGVAQSDGSCVCSDPAVGTGPSCSEYTNSRTCSSNGVAQSDGSCVCSDPAVGTGPTCSEYTNSRTCSGSGVAQYYGSCLCFGPAVGTGPSCQYSNSGTCSGDGVAQFDGSCVCSDPAVGTGPSCSEYSNSRTCSGNGVAQFDGSCVCSDPAVGTGPTCSEYSNSRTCSGNGVAQHYGSCVCSDPALGTGPNCQYSNSRTCSGNGVAQFYGACVCSDAAVGTGPTCSEYSNNRTCSGNGVAHLDGSCVCSDPAVGTGPTCSEYSNNRTCSGSGVAQFDGSCVCETDSFGDACQASATALVYNFAGVSLVDMSEQEKEDFKIEIRRAYITAATFAGIRIAITASARQRRDVPPQHSGSDGTASCREFQHAVDAGQFPSWMAGLECRSRPGCTWDNQSLTCSDIGRHGLNATNMLANVTLGSQQRDRRQDGTCPVDHLFSDNLCA